MIIHKSNIKEIEKLVYILNQQINYLKESGIPQWQNGYPNKEVLIEDIEKDRLYSLIENDEVIGFFALVYPDINYDYIEDGKWLSNGQYIAIHRVAIKNAYKGKGYSNKIFDYVKERYDHIRVDTHALNKVMNASILKNNFKYCGVVYMQDKTKRNAYEWIR